MRTHMLLCREVVLKIIMFKIYLYLRLQFYTKNYIIGIIFRKVPKLLRVQEFNREWLQLTTNY